MKNFKKFTAFVLTLCMLFSLSISAFAAEKTPTGYLTWTLDDSGALPSPATAELPHSQARKISRGMKCGKTSQA